MRHVLLPAAVLFGGVTSALAQGSERLEVSAIARTDRVSFEGNQQARMPVTGVGVSYRVWRDMRLEGEVTRASGESRRSYEADFFSFATTREDYDRLAVIARRTTVNKAGLGFATAVAVETRQPGRFNIALRAGISGRQYRYTDERTILRVPEGFTVEQGRPQYRMLRGAARGAGCCLVRASLSGSLAGFTSRLKCVGCGAVRRWSETITTKAVSARASSGSSDLLKISYADFETEEGI